MIKPMRTCISLLILLVILCTGQGAVLAAPDAWSTLAPGIDSQLYHLTQPRPINLFVARLARSEPSVTIDTAIAQGSLASGREKTSDMAARYDQAINYWGQTWGNRNRVVVAINGYFFNLSTGTPLSGQITSGWYAQRFSDYVGDAGFAWNLNGGAFIGKCVFHTPRSQFLTVLRNSEIQKIHGLNTLRGADQLVLYTPQYAASTGTDNNGVEILVEMSRPTLVLPDPAQAVGQVVKIRDGHGNTPIPFDHVVLSATGTVRSALLTKLVVGDEIGISQEISDCPNSRPTYWTKTYAAMGGDNHFLTAGALTVDTSNPDSALPNSRTAIAYNASYVYFIVVDGWNRGVSEGISMAELGSFAKNTLQASDAVSLDSGSSSTMVIQGQVVNNTYCNIMRTCGVQSAVESGRWLRFDREPAPPEMKGASPAAPDLEVLSGNAMLMITVEPKARSGLFTPGQTAQTAQAAELRLGPGSNYAVTGSLPAGATVTILGSRYNEWSGILAKGSFWQRVEAGDLAGWLRQESLAWTPPPGWSSIYLPLVRR
jgi:hypothetical protein